MAVRRTALCIRSSVAILLVSIMTVFFSGPTYLQANDNVRYFDTTGHYVDNMHGFLSYWRDTNGELLLGAPVTEVVEENGVPVQYFERGRLENHLELDGAPILMGRVGAEYAAALWRTFPTAPPRTATADETFFEMTGHTLKAPFQEFWQAHGGLNTFGYPISEQIWEYVGNQMILVQYFERSRLEHTPLARGTSDAVRISSIGRDLALLRGLDIAPQAAPAPAAPVEAAVPVEPVAAPVEPVAVPVEPVAVPEPVVAVPVEPVVIPAPQPAARGGKYVIVNISHQWLYAYEGDILVFDAPVTTGKDGFNTPAGNFSIYAKVPSQTMSGTLGGEYYSVPNVPHAMYINGGVALHGTYWHNAFGSGVRLSHGCINLPLGSAGWLYDWAPVGTPVQVTY